MEALRKINISRKVATCPRCGALSRRYSVRRRKLRELGISKPLLLEVAFSRHYCEECDRYFSVPMDHLALPRARFTNRVRRTAVNLVIKDALTLAEATDTMRTKHYVHVPPTTLWGWVIAELTLA